MTYKVSYCEGQAGHEKTIWEETVDGVSAADALRQCLPCGARGWVIKTPRDGFACASDPDAGGVYSNSFIAEVETLLPAAEEVA